MLKLPRDKGRSEPTVFASSERQRLINSKHSFDIIEYACRKIRAIENSSQLHGLHRKLPRGVTNRITRLCDRVHEGFMACSNSKGISIFYWRDRFEQAAE